MTSVFQAVTPPIVAVTAVLLGRERARPRVFVAIGIAGIGMVLVGLTGGDSSGHVVPLGALLAIASSAWYAGYLLAGERIVKNVQPLVLGCLIATGGAIGFSAGSLAIGQLQFEFGSRAWLWFALSALVSTVFAVTAVMAGMDRLGPSLAGLLTTFETPSTIVYATIVFGESLSVRPVGGRRARAGGGGRGAAAEPPRRYRFGRMTTTRETIEAAFSGAIPAEDARAAVDEAHRPARPRRGAPGRARARTAGPSTAGCSRRSCCTSASSRWR